MNRLLPHFNLFFFLLHLPGDFMRLCARSYEVSGLWGDLMLRQRSLELIGTATHGRVRSERLSSLLMETPDVPDDT